MANLELRDEWLKLCEQAWSELDAQQLVALTAQIRYYLSQQEGQKRRILQFPDKTNRAGHGTRM